MEAAEEWLAENFIKKLLLDLVVRLLLHILTWLWCCSVKAAGDLKVWWSEHQRW